MRRTWTVAAVAAGLALAVGGCGDDPGDGGGTASAEATCAAAEQAMTELGASLQTALSNWDGTPEDAGEIVAVTGRWGQELRDLAADASDPELRRMLEDLATRVDDFGASWVSGNQSADLAEVDAALQPLDDRCGFGAGAALEGDPTTTPQACAAALAGAVETWAASFEDPAAPDDLTGFQAAVTGLGAVCG